MNGEVGALAEVAPRQAVEILVRPALPRVMRIGEVDVEVEVGGELGVTGHLVSLVPGEGAAQLGRHAQEERAQAGAHAVSVGAARELAEHAHPRRPLHEGHHRRRVAFADDEVALPVAGLGAVDGRGRAQVDEGEGLQGAGLGRAGRLAALAAPPLAVEAVVQPRRQAFPAMGVHGLVDRLGAHRVAAHAPGPGQLDGDRGRGVELEQLRLHVGRQCAVCLELGRLRTRALPVGPFPGVNGAVTEAPAVPVHLVGHRRGRPAEGGGDVGERLISVAADPDLLALVRVQRCTCHAEASNGSSLGVARPLWPVRSDDRWDSPSLPRRDRGWRRCHRPSRPLRSRPDRRGRHDVRGSALGAVDAAVVAVAERRGIVDLAALDQDFRIVRPRQTDAFVLLPWSCSQRAS